MLSVPHAELSGTSTMQALWKVIHSQGISARCHLQIWLATSRMQAL